MRSLGRSSRAAIVATVLLFGSTAHAAPADPPQLPDTVEVLTDVLESLRADDEVGYDDAVDELIDDGHWLPTAGWDAIEDGDDGLLSLVWLLLDAPREGLLLYALEQVTVERDLVAAPTAQFPFDAEFLETVDEDGYTILEVIDHRGLGISTQLRNVLMPLPLDPQAAPTIGQYDEALALLTGRLENEGFEIPDFDDGGVFSGPMPGGELPMPEPVDAVGTDDAVDEPAEPTDEPQAPVAEPTAEPTAEVDAPAVAPAGADAASDVEPQPTDETPPIDQPAAADPTPSETPSDTSSGDGFDPAMLALGAVALVAIFLALMALRGNRHTGRLADIAFTDALTGLANRRRLDDDLAQVSRQGERPTAVLMIDVDHFKQFNDDHGHAVGDEVLRRVADIIAANVREIDLPYRYGGEEFSVLLPGTSVEDAQAVGERVRAAIECAHFDVGGQPVSVTASIGLSAGHATELHQLVRRADEALYVAKDNGRNQLVGG